MGRKREVIVQNPALNNGHYGVRGQLAIARCYDDLVRISQSYWFISYKCYYRQHGFEDYYSIILFTCE